MITDCRVSVSCPAFEPADQLSGERAEEAGDGRMTGNQGGTPGQPRDVGQGNTGYNKAERDGNCKPSKEHIK